MRLIETLPQCDEALNIFTANGSPPEGIVTDSRVRVVRAQLRLWPLDIVPLFSWSRWRQLVMLGVVWIAVAAFTLPACPPAFLLLWIGVGLWLFAVHRQARRLRRQIIKRWCAGCGYDLSGLPESLPGVLARTGGSDDVVSVGPEVCPECGVRWPLVPRL